jgi:DNA end-binding protein Ku
MVSIPVKLYTATESQDLTFRQLHATDNSPIKLVKRCAADGKDLEADEIVKGYEYTKSQYVLVSDEDMDSLPMPSKQVIELSSFVPGGEIDPIYYEKSYFVEPEEIAKKPFALLAKVLADRNFVAIGRLAMRSRERLCALRPKDGGIQLETLYYADEVRSPEFDVPEAQAAEAEMKIANALVDLLTEPFEPSKYRDEYREALLALITAKLEGRELVSAPEPEVAKPAVDLMAALRASVEAARAKKEGKPRSPTRAGKAKTATTAEAELEEVKAPVRRRKTAASKS